MTIAHCNSPGLKILAVDDDDDFLFIYKKWFHDIGHEIETCPDGESALDVADKLCPDIVVTDLVMPGINGIELMRKLREQSPDLEFIIISGHGKLDDSITSFREGATDFFGKTDNTG